MEPPPTAAELAESTAILLARAQGGDADAADRLFARYLPALLRWARGRLPAWARDAGDTEDLVQQTVINTMGRLEAFTLRHPGAFRAYLRQAFTNHLRDAIRRAGRRPQAESLSSGLEEDDARSPIEQVIGREALDRYERALRRLRDVDRAAVIGRVELGLDYSEIAEVLGKPSADAARVAIRRALVRLAEEMDRG